MHICEMRIFSSMEYRVQWFKILVSLWPNMARSDYVVHTQIYLNALGQLGRNLIIMNTFLKCTQVSLKSLGMKI